jgi:catechol 2,3-dioxygenase-like lactoylglutathione lyase family enzyme
MLGIMTDPLVLNIGHITIPVRDMKQTLAFYRDLLGFTVEGKEDPVWTVVQMEGVRLTLYRQKEFLPIAIGPKGDGTPFLLHVKDFGKAAEILESKGVRVKREGPHSGVIWDPSGNALGLHDHLESAE